MLSSMNINISIRESSAWKAVYRCQERHKDRVAHEKQCLVLRACLEEIATKGWYFLVAGVVPEFDKQALVGGMEACSFLLAGDLADADQRMFLRREQAAPICSNRLSKKCLCASQWRLMGISPGAGLQRSRRQPLRHSLPQRQDRQSSGTG